MVDIHCHILPELDDGASSMGEALEMARMAYRSGVKDVIATSHFTGLVAEVGRMELMRDKYELLVQKLKEEDIPLKLHLGAEILCTPETPELARMGELPTLVGTNYVLAEFFFDESFDYMDTVLADIAQCGYRPIVAHPERYEAVQRDPRLLSRWARMGYVLQLNKGSVLGALGSRAQDTANELLALGLAHLFASDAHSYHRRTPHMSQLRHWVAEHCDRDYAQILLERNPRRVLEGRPMVGQD